MNLIKGKKKTQKKLPLDLLYLIILILKTLYFIYLSFIKYMTPFSKQWRATIDFFLKFLVSNHIDI